jgi:predicted ATPase
MPHLRSVALNALPEGAGEVFPFSVPIIRHLGLLDVAGPVTFLVGENGSGKSTLLEGVAAAANLPTIGSESVSTDDTLAPQRALARSLKLVWNRPVKKRGFFLRAEDFFGFTKSLSKLRADLLRRAMEIDSEFANRSAWAKGLAMLPVGTSLAGNGAAVRHQPGREFARPELSQALSVALRPRRIVFVG